MAIAVARAGLRCLGQDDAGHLRVTRPTGEPFLRGGARRPVQVLLRVRQEHLVAGGLYRGHHRLLVLLLGLRVSHLPLTRLVSDPPFLKLVHSVDLVRFVMLL